MLSFSTAKWVAVYTQSHAEKKVLERLTQQGFEAYLPIIAVKRHWSDRIKLVETPLFHSYIFVKIKKNEPILIRNTPGVVYIVAFRNEIATIPDQEIENIQRLIDQEQELFIQETSRLHKKTAVRIIEGPFAGMEGILIDDCKNGNFSIRIEAIGLSIVTHINQLMLEVKKQPKNSKEIDSTTKQADNHAK